MIEIKEVLRLGLAGHSLREVTRLAELDRKTVRRYVQAAQACGVTLEGGDGQLTEEVLGAAVAVVRPDRPRGTGASWEAIAEQREQIQTWLKQDLTLAKIHMLLRRWGVVVPYRTLHRFAVAELGFGRRRGARARLGRRDRVDRRHRDRCVPLRQPRNSPALPVRRIRCGRHTPALLSTMDI
ncbi:hypothetical protein [Kibdelosporangium aridum]|uniref:Uncharacterized protein n=1 Tax=Kibdelosporangium aridum TaxID=2030 RepID=A0A1Y5YC79_KIBAR|nr:hypothetical protein [Kibdelosporangium aridum]SMD27460.1 hypothetical protein SAMN05661093_11067 [Kibdelosporangium aridum]